MTGVTNRYILLTAIVLTFITVLTIHMFCFPLTQRIVTNGTLLKSAYNFEQSLCVGNVVRRPKTSYEPHRRRRCPLGSSLEITNEVDGVYGGKPLEETLDEDDRVAGGFVTAEQGGRLGNQMWEYASVLGVACVYNLEPIVPVCIKDTLSKVFRSLTLPTFNDIPDCKFDIRTTVSEPLVRNQTMRNVVLRHWPIRPKEVIACLPQVLKEFQLNARLVNYAQGVLHTIRAKYTTTEPLTYVAVHVRRQDYLRYLSERTYGKARLPNASFYLAAMEYFELKYDNVVFLVASDDPGWCFKELYVKKPNLHLISGEKNAPPEHDLAVLVACNHTIMDFGTYGFWAALLAGGEVLFFNLHTNASQYYFWYFQKVLPNWSAFP